MSDRNGSNPRTGHIGARVTEQDSAMLSALAAVTGDSVSEIVSRTIHEYLRGLDIESLIQEWDTAHQEQSKRMRALLQKAIEQ